MWEKLVRSMATIDGMQFGFMPGRGTTDAIFNLRQLQVKYLSKNKHLYLAFIDPEKAFDHVSHAVLWRAMRKLGVDEWLVRIIQLMNQNTFSKVRVGDTYRNPLSVNFCEGRSPSGKCS